MAQPVESMIDMTPTRLIEDLCRLDRVFDEVDDDRTKVINKLGDIIPTIEINPGANPRVTEVQMQVINTYLSAIKDREMAIDRRASRKLKMAETESSSRHAADIAETLRQIATGSFQFRGKPSSHLSEEGLIDHERRLSDIVSKSGLEPIMDTELRTDPDHLG